jgi:hypothetical protein
MQASRWADGGVGSTFGISMAEEEVHQEQKKNDEIMSLLEEMVTKSGFFIPEKIPELMARLKDSQRRFGRVNTKPAFDGNVCLSIEEKRALGLNPRMKYSRTFIGCFNPASFKTIEPRRTLECMHLDAFYRVSRKSELLKLKKLGWVKQVKICPVGDADDCDKVKRMKKIYGIDEVPELPIAGCDSQYCRCIYEAIIPEE